MIVTIHNKKWKSLLGEDFITFSSSNIQSLATKNTKEAKLRCSRRILEDDQEDDPMSMRSQPSRKGMTKKAKKIATKTRENSAGKDNGRCHGVLN